MNGTPSLAYVTPATAPSWKRWLVCSPLARIVIFMVLFIALNFMLVNLLVDLAYAALDPRRQYEGR